MQSEQKSAAPSPQPEQKIIKQIPQPRTTPTPVYPSSARKIAPRQTSSFDVSDASVWKNATLILQHFPGTVHEVKESSHE